MEYFSTRGTEERLTASEAISRGLAPDGGLFVPDTLPQIGASELAGLLPLGYGERAKCILAAYLPEYSDAELEALVSACASRTIRRAISSSGTVRPPLSRIWPFRCCRTC